MTNYGDGWLTREAADLARIAIHVAGFDARELTVRLASQPHRGERLNSRTVERVLGEMA